MSDIAAAKQSMTAWLEATGQAQIAADSVRLCVHTTAVAKKVDRTGPMSCQINYPAMGQQAPLCVYVCLHCTHTLTGI